MSAYRFRAPLAGSVTNTTVTDTIICGGLKTLPMGESSTQQEALAETPIVDTDVHLRVPPELLKEYVDEPHRGYLEGPFGSTNDILWDVYMGEKIGYKDFHTPADVRADLIEGFNVDYPIINAFGKLSYLPQSDRAVSFMRGYNDFLLDNFLDEDEDLLALAELAPQKPDKAAEEIDRLANEDQIVGVFLLTTGPNPPLGDPKYDIIYETAQDNGLPVAYHASAASSFKHEFPRQHQAFETFLEVHALGHFWSQSMNLTSLMVNGAPVKFPDLDFVFLEAGISWLPYMMFRLNKEVAMRRSEAPLLEKTPEEYIRDSFYFSTQPLGEPNDPDHMRQLIEIVGCESLLFSSDYPHFDFDHPTELGKYLYNMFDEEEMRAVLYENAFDVFNIDR